MSCHRDNPTPESLMNRRKVRAQSACDRRQRETNGCIGRLQHLLRFFVRCSSFERSDLAFLGHVCRKRPGRALRVCARVAPHRVNQHPPLGVHVRLPQRMIETRRALVERIVDTPFVSAFLFELRQDFFITFS